MRTYLRCLLWCSPLLLYAENAAAWGLYTHVYFAQLLPWAIPLLDPAVLRAARKFPSLVMAGACLPDLALTGRILNTHAFAGSHQWKAIKQLQETAETDEEIAIALGFASHLLVDIIAHNHFVLVHEKIWADVPVITHAACEWAMDHHIRERIELRPGTLMRTHHAALMQFCARHFDCDAALAGKALTRLAYADNLLRVSGISFAVYHGSSLVDSNLNDRFNHYLDETTERLEQINRLWAGDAPCWNANLGAVDDKWSSIRKFSHAQLVRHMPLPENLFDKKADTLNETHAAIQA